MEMGFNQEEEVWLLSLAEVEHRLTYKFSDKNLLKKTFTHPSYNPDDTKESYERLEYLGDSVLNFVISKKMFLSYPGSSPGLLTRLRAANVDNEKLARVVVKYRLYLYLRHKALDMENQVRAFNNDILNYPIHSNGLIETPKFLVDIVESTVGAIFVESNYSLEILWTVFTILGEPIISPEALSIHPVKELSKLCHKNKLRIDFVDGSTETCRTFSVFWSNSVIGTSTSASTKKEIVKNRAAKAALDYLKVTLPLAN